MARVARGDPGPLLTRDWADERQQILGQPEDPCPAVRDLRHVAEQLDEERIERFLDRLGRRLVVRHLREDREVAEAAEDDASVRELLPVIEPVTCVMRAIEEPFAQGFRRYHLAARRPDCVVELWQETASRSVGGDHDLLGGDLVERRNPMMLAERDAFCGCLLGKTTDEPPRLQRAVRRMEDRAVELGAQMRQLFAPRRRESVLVQRFVLQPDLVTLLVVGRKAKAACAAESISGNRLEPVERAFGSVPELLDRKSTRLNS